jgi:lipopolysaccharide transport system ATP-binding protein
LDQFVLQCEGVGKKFCASLKKSMLYGGADILQNSLGITPNSSVLRKDEFWAVDDVSFSLKEGECFGIIGPNGSGKTTLLKMLNGIFMPDKGRITVNGKVSALIQVGAGFHPMLSGRENIYINGAILGMSKKEVDQKFDAIVDFAQIGDFLDAPVKNYSSGMYVRLGFAIAVHGDPKILLIDEILAVGDKEFQIKCYQKMNEIKKMGTTIILVAHNEYTIREYTQRCLYLDHGKQRFLGSSEEAINVYIKDIHQHKANHQPDQSSVNTSEHKPVAIQSLKFLNADGREIDFIESGAPITLLVQFTVHQQVHSMIVGVNFYGGNTNGLTFAVNSDYEKVVIKEFLPGEHSIKIHIPHFHLPTDDYLCSVTIAKENVTNLIDWHDYKYKLVVGRAPNARGLLKLPTQWSM